MTETILAKRLKELRKAHNYTQEYIASYLDIARQSYSHYETSRNIPNTESIYKLATLYSIRPEDLLQLTFGETLNNYNVNTESDDELSLFLDYINDTANEKKLRNLNRREKELLYYYEKLDMKDQEDILDFIRIKCRKKI